MNLPTVIVTKVIVAKMMTLKIKIPKYNIHNSCKIIQIKKDWVLKYMLFNYIL